MQNMSKLCERLTDLMFESDISSAELAESVAVTVQTVNRWKRGEKQMRLSNLIKVANVLNCTIDFLVGRNDSMLDFLPKECPRFYDRLREVMEEKNRTWYRVTTETSIKDSYLYLWKKGYDTKIPALVELADYLDVTIDYLVGRDR